MPIKKTALKKTAIELRSNGMSYNDIRKQLGVAKSTLSTWLRNVPLTTAQRYKLAAKRPASNGPKKNSELASIKRSKRLKRADDYFSDVKLDRSSLILVGAALYWAEGAKSSNFTFTNSDPDMIRFFLRWLRDGLHAPEEHIILRVHTYLDAGKSLDEIEAYWKKVTQTKKKCFRKSLVNHKPSSSKQTKIGKSMYGTLRISLRRPIIYYSVIASLLKKLGKNTYFVEESPFKASNRKRYRSHEVVVASHPSKLGA